MHKSIIGEARETFHEDGLYVFAKKSIKYIVRKSHAQIRPLLPKNGFINRNSVKVDNAKLGDNLLGQRSRPNYEDGLISGHEKYTRQGDSVVIIGGGFGVTAVRTSKIVGDTGEVTVFEGGAENVEKIRRVAKLNSLDGISVRHVIIGQARKVDGDTTDAKIISPTNLPECDVLELDCEGAEIDVLNELDFLPRVVIVELHPWLYSDRPEKPIDLLEKLGYEIQYYSGHDGVEISQEEFDLLLQKSRDWDNEQRGHVESGARWPVVAGGILY